MPDELPEKEVIILGTGSSAQQCDFHCETWAVNGAFEFENVFKRLARPFRIDKLFITDDLWSVYGAMHFDIDQINQCLERNNAEAVLLKPIKLGKHEIRGVPYPWDYITKKFNTTFFTSTIGFMLAYGLDKGYNTFWLYGIDMASQMEYILQKGGVEYWCGRIHQAGGKVIVAQGSTILVPPSVVPYGFQRELNLEKIDPYNVLGYRKDSDAVLSS